MGLFRKKEVVDDSQCSLRIVTQSRSFSYVEAYKSLRTNLNYVVQANGPDCKVIMLTSSMPSEGKSNVSVNLAVSLAQDGKKVILVDCDLRKGTLHRYLRIPRRLPGLTSLLTEQARLEEVGHHFKDLEIDVIAAGFVPDNPSELLGSERMGKVLQILAAQYDFVLCDTPPVSAVSDASALSRFVDGAVLVVSHNQVTRQSALAAKAQLESGNVPILGAVLNLYDAKQSSDGGRTYAYYNYEYYGSGDSGTARPQKRKQAETGDSRRAKSE